MLVVAGKQPAISFVLPVRGLSRKIEPRPSLSRLDVVLEHPDFVLRGDFDVAEPRRTPPSSSTFEAPVGLMRSTAPQPPKAPVSVITMSPSASAAGATTGPAHTPCHRSMSAEHTPRGQGDRAGDRIDERGARASGAAIPMAMRPSARGNAFFAASPFCATGILPFAYRSRADADQIRPLATSRFPKRSIEMPSASPRSGPPGAGRTVPTRVRRRARQGSIRE